MTRSSTVHRRPELPHSEPQHACRPRDSESPAQARRVLALQLRGRSLASGANQACRRHRGPNLPPPCSDPVTSGAQPPGMPAENRWPELFPSVASPAAGTTNMGNINHRAADPRRQLHTVTLRFPPSLENTNPSSASATPTGPAGLCSALDDRENLPDDLIDRHPADLVGLGVLLQPCPSITA